MKKGHTENWTRIIGFKVQCANHYTIRPHCWFLRCRCFVIVMTYIANKWSQNYKCRDDWLRLLLRGGYFSFSYKRSVFSCPTFCDHNLPHQLEEDQLLPHAHRTSVNTKSFYLCVSCLIQNLYVLIYPPMTVNSDMNDDYTPSAYCIFEAMIKTGFDLSSIIWTLIIMYSTFATVVHGYMLERL